MTHIIGKLKQQEDQTIVMLGNFDGFHIGHQKLLQALIKCGGEENLVKVVFSFFPHPASFFTGQVFNTIYTSTEKAYILSKSNVDIFLEYPFDRDVANFSPEDFVENVLAHDLNCKHVIVGKGFLFGKQKSGNEDVLQEECAKHGIKVTVVQLECSDGEKVSSTNIRNYIKTKNFSKASSLLLKPYFIRDTVVSGRQIGRTLGFPTANLIPDESKLLPPDGVYKTETVYNGKTYKSMTNIGFNPTVGLVKKRVVETTIIDFNKDIYGETIQVNFEKWIRGEVKFPNLEELTNQLYIDLEICSK